MNRNTLLTCWTFAIFTLILTFSPRQASALGWEDWTREISLGYTRSSGNTDNAALDLRALAKTELDTGDFSTRFDLGYSQSDNQMDSQDWTSLTRYAHDISEDGRWFNPWTLEIFHDKFADIDYRVTPSIGLGYWFLQDEDRKFSLEGAFGYEKTEYYNDSDETMIFQARGYYEQKILDNAKISQEVIVTPALDGESGVRVKSETGFTNPLSDSLNLDTRYIVDYDSEPAAGKTSTDTKLVVGLNYSF